MRSEHDDGNQHGSAGKDGWRRIYRGDSFEGLKSPDDREDDNDDNDDDDD